MPLTKLPDTMLAEMTRGGKTAAYGELWRRHESVGRAVAHRYAGGDAEDVLQEAASQIYQAFAKGNGPTGEFRPYLVRTVRNVAVSLSRRRSAHAVGGASDLEQLPEAPTAELGAESFGERSRLVQAFRKLPTRWRAALWYTAVEGMPPREAALYLGLNPNATAALASRARAGLRAELAKLDSGRPVVAPL